MKINKGFTLIELIAVITVLGIITLITVPAVNKVITKSKEKALEQQTSNIVDAAKQYAIENTNLLPKYDQGQTLIHVSDLVLNGFLGESPTDPTTKEIMSDCVVITYNESANKYSYEYGECKINIEVDNIYVGGDRLITFSQVSSDEELFVSDFFENFAIDEISLIEKYKTESMVGNSHVSGIMYDENDIAIDGFYLIKVVVPQSYMYMDFYHLFQILIEYMEEEQLNEEIQIKQYIFGDPNSLTIYIGYSYMSFTPDEATLEIILQELGLFSGKNIHTLSDLCQFFSDLVDDETFTCDFDTMAEIKIN